MKVVSASAATAAARDMAKRSRSRRGCYNCKRLKIKCDEARPSCEYCRHTRRECVYEHQAGAGDVVIRVESFNAPSRHLNINRFELRLLHFFLDYCVQLFTFGVEPEMEKLWRVQVPPLFMSSAMVRQAVYSFATINLWPICDVQTIEVLDARESGHELVNSFDRSSSVQGWDDPNASLVPLTLYTRTLEYFGAAIRLCLEVVGNVDHHKITDPMVHGQFLVSGIVVFAFLGIHPHRLFPLFDPDLNMDFLSYIRDYGRAALASVQILDGSPIAGMLKRVPVVVELDTTLPVVQHLRDELHDLVPFGEISSTNSKDLSFLSHFIERLEDCIQLCAQRNYPVPLFRYLLKLPERVHELLREQHPLAMHILYLYACLCALTRFNLFDKASLWMDFVQWYCRLRTLTPYEKTLQLLVNSGLRVPYKRFKHLGTFDPEAAWHDYSKGTIPVIFQPYVPKGKRE